MEIFRKLGEEIEAGWRELNYDEEAFPKLAADALKRTDLPSQVSAWEIIEWALKQVELPPQKDVQGSFGDPPITLFASSRFYIDVYFWLEGTTSIHQHGFCGAFQVLMGSSIHSWYSFDIRERVNSFVEIGDIGLNVCQLLEKNDIQEIQAGRRYIHSLFHLDQPSATIVVRTEKSPMFLPQYSYHKPYLAIDPFFHDDTTTKKLQSISALFRAKHPDTDRMVNELLETSDFQSSIEILTTVSSFLNSNSIDQFFNLSQPADRFRTFMETVRNRHGVKADVLPAVFEHREMVNEIVRRRGFVTDAEHRFFFALLMNVEGKDAIFNLIRKRFPDADPLEKVLDWVFDLSQTRVMGANAQNALGIESFDNIDILIFEGVLRDKTGDQIADELKREAGENPEILKDLETRLTRLREAIIFRPLFARAKADRKTV
jgi:hypothetical protein